MNAAVMLMQDHWDRTNPDKAKDPTNDVNLLRRLSNRLRADFGRRNLAMFWYGRHRTNLCIGLGDFGRNKEGRMQHTLIGKQAQVVWDVQPTPDGNWVVMETRVDWKGVSNMCTLGSAEAVYDLLEAWISFNL